MFELGAFAVFNVLSFGLLGYGANKHLPLSGLLHLLSMVFFFFLAFTMMIEEDIGQTMTITDGTVTWTETKTFMADEDTFYLIYVYFGFALISLLTFMITRGTNP